MANDQVPSIPSDKRAAIDAFRKKLAAQAAGVAPGQRGRLIFGIDCTASREHCWEMASQLQVEMFQEAANTGGVEIQLATYRGSEFETSDWVSDGRALAEKMREVHCVTGFTQIEKVLAHALRENQRRKIQTLVFVGDAMEEREETLFAIARELGQHGVPVFLFQEGDHPNVSRVFAEIAKLTKGAHCHFTAGAARELADLLRAVAAYAAGGRDALSANKTAAAAKLLLQLPPR
jgi:hypothetical protein